MAAEERRLTLTIQRRTIVTLLVLALGLTGCGDDSPTAPSPPMDVAGAYWLQVRLDVRRHSDGFERSFVSVGSLTLVQGPAAGRTAPLTGFAVTGVSPTVSHDLEGTIDADGVIQFTTDAPPPSEGPCPGGENVWFAGQARVEGGTLLLTLRGTTVVTCPEFGDHDFAYRLDAGQRGV
jgi:hypothetical protein